MTAQQKTYSKTVLKTSIEAPLPPQKEYLLSPSSILPIHIYLSNQSSKVP